MRPNAAIEITQKDNSFKQQVFTYRKSVIKDEQIINLVKRSHNESANNCFLGSDRSVVAGRCFQNHAP